MAAAVEREVHGSYFFSFFFDVSCGRMLEVSRDAAAAGEEQLVSCAAEPSKCCSICTATLGPFGDLPFASWDRWQCFRGGADGLE
jgi:hypothetical protein